MMAETNPTISADTSISTMSVMMSAMPSWRRATDSLSDLKALHDHSSAITVDKRQTAQADLRHERLVGELRRRAEPLPRTAG